MENMLVNSNNWTHTSYSDGDLQAIITFGASTEILDDNFIYFVTIMDKDNNEVFQMEFDDIDTACHHINNKYHGQWDFQDKLSTKSSKSGGCSTCIAH